MTLGYVRQRSLRGSRTLGLIVLHILNSQFSRGRTMSNPFTRTPAVPGANGDRQRDSSRSSFSFYLIVVLAGMLVFMRPIPAFASGSVEVIYPPPAMTSPIGWGTACFEMNGQGLCGVRTAGAACSYWNTQYGWTFNWTGQVIALSCDMWNCPMTRDGKTYNFTLELVTPAVCPASYAWDPLTGKCIRSKCPDHASPSQPVCVSPVICTCDDNYVPDPTEQSCVPAISCPAPSTSDGAGGCACNPPNRINSEGVCDACPIDPLPKPPFDGDTNQACTESLEKGKGKDVDNACPPLDPRMTEPNGGQMQCLADKIHALAIPYTEPSGTVRTEAYQKHFQDIWKKWEEIQNLKTDADKQACTAVIADVTREKDEIHGIDSPPSKKEGDAPHVLGDAVDVPRAVAKALIARVPAITVSMLPGCFSCTITITGDVENYVNSATVNPPACDLRWGGQFTPVDRVHFQLP